MINWDAVGEILISIFKGLGIVAIHLIIGTLNVICFCLGASGSYDDEFDDDSRSGKDLQMRRNRELAKPHDQRRNF